MKQIKQSIKLSKIDVHTKTDIRIATVRITPR